VHAPDGGQSDRPPPLPELFKRVAAVEHGHDVEPKALGPGDVNAEMAGVTAAQDFFAQRRHEDGLGSQFAQGQPQARQVLSAG